MEKTKSLNEITLIGEVMTIDQPFEAFGAKFNQIVVGVKRLSGNIDYIPVVFREIPNITFGLLDRVKVVGTIRTRNVKVDNKNKLIIYVYGIPENVDASTEEDVNEFSLEGFVCKEVSKRETPLHKKIADMTIAHNAYGKSYYFPCIVFNTEADRAANLNVGDKITMSGRFQSRDYNKVLPDGSSVLKTAYELVVTGFNLVDNQ